MDTGGLPQRRAEGIRGGLTEVSQPSRNLIVPDTTLARSRRCSEVTQDVAAERTPEQRCTATAG